MFVCSSDWHLRDTVPICRLDKNEYYNRQFEKVKFITELSESKALPLLLAGDLFDRCSASFKLINNIMDYLPKDCISCAGNHEEPNHNYDLIRNSPFSIISRQFRHGTTQQFSLDINHWNYKIQRVNKVDDAPRVLLTHELVWHKDKPFPTLDDTTNAYSVMNKYKEYDIIVSGHVHNSFVVRKGKQLLINAGSIMRMSATQKDFKPSVYIVHDDLSYERVFIPIEKDVVSDKHLIKKKEKEIAFDKFVAKLQFKTETKLDFRDNINSFFNENKIKQNVETITRNSIT